MIEKVSKFEMQVNQGLTNQRGVDEMRTELTKAMPKEIQSSLTLKAFINEQIQQSNLQNQNVVDENISSKNNQIQSQLEREIQQQKLDIQKQVTDMKAESQRMLAQVNKIEQASKNSNEIPELRRLLQQSTTEN